MKRHPRSPRRDCVWVDPRSDPKPGAVQVPPRVAEEPAAIGELLAMCQKGRLYAVEGWVQEGKPLQAAYSDVHPYRRVTTPLVVAIENDQHDLALLLLCNGYRTELEPHSPLNTALRRRNWEFVELLLAWGADPTVADPEAVLDTYQVSMMDRFWDLGLDLTRDRCLASYLSETTSNKPAYGWAKRHAEDPRVANALSLALGEAVWDRREKAVALLVWAGADPHRRVPSLRYSDDDDDPDDDRYSAIEHAVMFGEGRLLKYLSPDPELDDFEELWGLVCDPETLDRLFDLRPPRDWSKGIVRNVSHMTCEFGDRSGNRACLERIFDHHWGRLTTLNRWDCQDLRRELLRMELGTDLIWLLERLAKPRHCARSIFAELVRTPAMRQKMDRLGLDGLVPTARSKQGRSQVQQPQRVRRSNRAPMTFGETVLNGLSSDDKAEVLRGLISREQL